MVLIGRECVIMSREDATVLKQAIDRLASLAYASHMTQVQEFARQDWLGAYNRLDEVLRRMDCRENH